MTMLTERDKKLLYLLAVAAVLAALVYLLLFPAISSYSELTEQIAVDATQVEERQAVIGQLEQTNLEVQQLRREIAQLTMQYPAAMHNLQLDRSYTQRAVLGRWEPTELILGERGLFELAHFSGAQQEQDEDNEDGDSDEQLGIMPSQLVSMKATARQSDIFAIMQLYASSKHEKLESLVIRDDIDEIVVDAAGNSTVVGNSDDPLLSVEYTIRQIFAVGLPEAVTVSGASLE